MALSVTNNIKESDISFNSKTLISNNSNWTVESGEVIIGSTIILGENSRCSMTTGNIQTDKLECTHLKLVAHLTCDDESYSTENAHKVCVLYNIEYIDKDNKEVTILDHFYPKYDFEDNYSDYSIIKVPSSYIKSVKVTLINNEDIPVKITNTGLYYSRVINEDTVKDTTIDSVQEAMNENIIVYRVPEMTLAEWEACDKSKWNECIIVG